LNATSTSALRSWSAKVSQATRRFYPVLGGEFRGDVVLDDGLGLVDPAGLGHDQHAFVGQQLAVIHDDVGKPRDVRLGRVEVVQPELPAPGGGGVKDERAANWHR
jgi:hypothetical protein